MNKNEFKITNADLKNLQAVFDMLHYSQADKPLYNAERKLYPYPPSQELHPDPVHPSNRISPIIDAAGITNLGVDNIRGLIKLFMTIQCDDNMKLKVDKAGTFLRQIIDKQIVTDWKPVFPGLRSRSYLKAASKEDTFLIFYHGSWRIVLAIEERKDSPLADCSFSNPYPTTKEACPILEIEMAYDSFYIITYKELKKLLQTKRENYEFFVQWISAAMKMTRAKNKYLLNTEAMYNDYDILKSIELEINKT